jgi:hypothetical protein
MNHERNLAVLIRAWCVIEQALPVLALCAILTAALFLS